ncbi:MAG TPA: gluconeogenesis factor YvcK family protein [Acidimicrobiales bacterium]
MSPDDPGSGPGPGLGDPGKLRVVALGGGHGLAASIRAARGYARRVTAVVSTADDGGSTGRLRSGMALPAPGDVRHCLAAMAGPQSGPLAEALEYRFDGTDVAGHALGNLVLAALTAVTGDFVAAVDEAARLLALDPDEARVLPATAEPVELRAVTVGGEEVVGQVAVSGRTDIDCVRVVPEGPPAPAEVVEALLDADQVVIGPGSLYTSVLAAAVVDDVRRALADSAGLRVYVCNLRAETSETRGYDVADHLAALARHGIAPDVVVVQPGALPLGRLGGGVEVVEADVARPHGLAHDSAKLGAALAALAG